MSKYTEGLCLYMEMSYIPTGTLLKVSSLFQNQKVTHWLGRTKQLLALIITFHIFNTHCATTVTQQKTKFFFFLFCLSVFFPTSSTFKCFTLYALLVNLSHLLPHLSLSCLPYICLSELPECSCCGICQQITLMGCWRVITADQYVLSIKKRTMHAARDSFQCAGHTEVLI